MTVYNCNPFNGNYVRCGSFGPACGGSTCGGCGCGSGCGNWGCGCGCGCGGCGNWGYGCGNCCGGCGCHCDPFIPTPEVPFPCASCSSCNSCNSCSSCCEENDTCGSCGSCGSCEGCSCSALRSQLDNIQYTVNEIYRLMAPVPYNAENYTA